MMTTERKLTGVDVYTHQPVELQIKAGMICEVRPIPLDREHKWPLIGTGLVDLQLNGYAGMDSNQFPLDPADVIRMTRLLWQEGVTTYYPTVITNSNQAIRGLVEAIAQACEQDSLVEQSIAGIHLEGPFISPEEGPRGAHPLEHVQAPNWELFQDWQERSKGRIKLITLSPEWAQASSFIRQAVRTGVRVAIGHTAATAKQIEAAVEAGAQLSTHLGNGAHLMLPRHPNYIWEQLAAQPLWASVIADGFHLPPSFLRVVRKVKGEKLILVSDAVSLSGLPAGQYENHIGGRVTLTEQGRLHVTGHPNLLAGSAQMLKKGVENMVKLGIANLSEAWRMASLAPSELMDLPTKLGLQVGAPADLLIFSQESDQLIMEQTYKSGQLVYQKSK